MSSIRPRPRPQAGSASASSNSAPTSSSSPSASQSKSQSQSSQSLSQSQSSQSSGSVVRATAARALAGIRPDELADADVDALFEDVGLMSSQKKLDDDDEEMMGYDDKMVQQLRTLWLNERAAPELLPYQHDLVQAIQKAVQTQQSLIDQYHNSNEMDTFMCTLLQMEIARVNYMLTSYLRIRLTKIEKYPFYMSSTLMQSRLSQAERNFASGYRATLEHHFKTSFIDEMIPMPDIASDTSTRVVNNIMAFTRQCQALDMKHEFQYMVEEPDISSFVFIRVKQTIPSFQLGKSGDVIEFRQGAIVLVSYEHIRSLLIEDKIELV